MSHTHPIILTVEDIFTKELVEIPNYVGYIPHSGDSIAILGKCFKVTDRHFVFEVESKYISQVYLQVREI